MDKQRRQTKIWNENYRRLALLAGWKGTSVEAFLNEIALPQILPSLVQEMLRSAAEQEGMRVVEETKKRDKS